MDPALLRILARLFDDPSGGVVRRCDANKTILRVPESPGIQQALFVKLYHYQAWSMQLRTVWRRLGGRHDLRVAQRLKHLGIPVPEPVAALVKRNALGWPGRSLYAAQWLPEAIPLARFIAPMKRDRADDATTLPLAETVGRFVRELHENGVRSKDLNSGNVLVRTAESGRIELFLVDYEHVRFVRSVPLDIRLRNLAQIGVHLAAIAQNGEYALCRGYTQWDGSSPDIDSLVREVSERVRHKRQSRQAVLDRRFDLIADAARKQKDRSDIA